MDGQVVGSLIGVGALTVMNVIGWVLASNRQAVAAAKNQGAFEEKVKGVAGSIGELKGDMGGLKKGVSRCHKDISGLSRRVASLENTVINGGKKHKKGGRVT